MFFIASCGFSITPSTHDAGSALTATTGLKSGLHPPLHKRDAYSEMNRAQRPQCKWSVSPSPSETPLCKNNARKKIFWGVRHLICLLVLLGGAMTFLAVSRFLCVHLHRLTCTRAMSRWHQATGPSRRARQEEMLVGRTIYSCL